MDFRKAFDFINRRKILQILKAYGIPTRLEDAIGKTYEETPANVSSSDSETEFFKITADVLQGDTLAPYLFIIVLVYVHREAIEGHEGSLGLIIKSRQGRKVKTVKVTNLNLHTTLLFLAISSNEHKTYSEILKKHQSSSNGKKTKYMLFNHHVDPELKTRDDEVTEPLENF